MRKSLVIQLARPFEKGLLRSRRASVMASKLFASWPNYKKVKEYTMFRLKVKEVAEQKGMSQRQLFLRSGVDITTIRKIFRDPHAAVSVEALAQLAKVLGVDVSTLIESADTGPDATNHVLAP